MTFAEWQVALDQWLRDQWMVGALIGLGIVCWVLGKVLADEPKLRKGRPPRQDPPR